MSNNIEVLFNGCYGGFTLSDEAVAEINKCFEENNKKKISKHCHTITIRTDPDVLKIYHLLGSKRFSGNYSKIITESIESKYKDFIHIEEYDGLENVTVNMSQYNLYKVNEILNSNSLSDSQKIEDLKKIMKYSYYSEVENE